VNTRTIRKLIGRYQKILRLEDWDVDYSPDYELDDPIGNQAEIAVKRTKKFAVMGIGEPLDTEKTIIHELLHLHFFDIEWLLQDILEQYVSDANAVNLINNQFEAYSERSVDAITQAIRGLSDK